MGEFIGFNTGAVFGFGLKTGAVFGCKGRRHSYVKCIPCGGDQYDTLVPQVVPERTVRVPHTDFKLWEPGRNYPESQTLWNCPPHTEEGRPLSNSRSRRSKCVCVGARIQKIFTGASTSGRCHGNGER
jgi:hypothetical protein